ncbi:MAG TPA: hypothetical protein GXX23_05730 [Firmicutes bacterium]|nr:hypothetical protein [Candidatus Fermentithermobacillaceae bacterium]
MTQRTLTLQTPLRRLIIIVAVVVVVAAVTMSGCATPVSVDHRTLDPKTVKS